MRDLASLLREAAEAHHVAETRIPPHDWADWYAAYITNRQLGREPDEACNAADLAVLLILGLTEEGGE